MRAIILVVISVILSLPSSIAQEAKVAAIAFYNLENLFDVYDDPSISDEEFTPEGVKRWTEDKYEEKLSNMAKVIAEMATEITPDGPAILGVSEIENKKVLEDLVKQPAIANRNYKI